MQDQDIVNIFKGLVIDSIHRSQSGHPGGPMSSMDLTYILFSEYLKFDPQDPTWMGRDRFILSAGHMSMLQYAMLFGIGWLTMDDLKSFRQFHSKTPGHPENFMTPGVECTTGPLGQGCSMAVGFAVAASHLKAVLDASLFDYKIWALVSDGDLQEGVALASASLAGHLQLSNLIWIYDKNHVQLSGPTKKCVSDHDEAVFTGLGWRVYTIDGHDHEEIRKAYSAALKSDGRPTIIIANTVIGKGCATMEDSYKTHGSPLPADERAKTKLRLGIPAGQEFYFPLEALKHFQRNFGSLRQTVKAWRDRQSHLYETQPSFRQGWEIRFSPPDVSKLPAIPWAKEKSIPTRNAFGDIIEAWASELPQLMGGSADLEPSNMTGAFAKKVGDFDAANRQGCNINFGVREFPMSALTNGMALHGGVIPFDATFLSFADYSRGALRLGAIQKVRVIHEFTHDSFYVGEDGPTHQPIEQVMGLRLIPDLYVMRPADPVETEVLMRKALSLSLPSAICLTRQKVPYLPLSREQVGEAAKGAYVIHETMPEKSPELILMATGSEVSLVLEASKHLSSKAVRVVSMPCWELFEEQPRSYKESVLPPSVTARVSVEAGTTIGWSKYVGLAGLCVGIDHFGASAPAEVLAKEYGFTVDSIITKIKQHFSIS